MVSWPEITITFLILGRFDHRCFHSGVSNRANDLIYRFIYTTPLATFVESTCRVSGTERETLFSREITAMREPADSSVSSSLFFSNGKAINGSRQSIINGLADEPGRDQGTKFRRQEGQVAAASLGCIIKRRVSARTNGGGASLRRARGLKSC